jgi:polar amino acid transport system permease protein
MKADPSMKEKYHRLWAHYRMRYGYLPWFRQYEFLIPVGLVLVLVGIFLLPPMGALSGWKLALIIGYALATIGWVLLLLTDIEKPRWLKVITVLGLLFLLGFLFYRYSGAQWDRLIDSFFNFSTMEGSWSVLVDGLVMTVKVAFVSMILSLIFGLIIAVLRSLNNPILNVFLIIYIDFFRAIPLIVLLVFVYYALPFLGISLDSYPSAITAISLCYAASVAEVFRSGIESIHRGQVEASRSLGLNFWDTMRLVILPQAIRVVVPPATGLMVALIKDTALASIIALPELLYRALQVLIFKVNATPVIVVSLFYLAILLPLTRLSSVLEKRSKQWVKRPGL